jgi:Icc-related predicted phosphoesterase
MADTTVRIAAAGDVHCAPENRDATIAAFAALAGAVDLVLLAGDLTTHGEPDQAAVLAEACAPLDIPVLAVLGNHDWHADRTAELTDVLREGGIDVLERESRTLHCQGVDVGVVGLKGMIGGFPGSHLPDFGEPILRRVYGETTADVEALDRGLRDIALCPLRIVLLHYSPSPATLIGETEGIWAYLGNDRLAAPIREHEPDIVLHGHAHAGRFEGSIGGVPVYNVSVPVLGKDFWTFELSGVGQANVPIH